jgi:acyl-CoA thioesterase I
MKIINIIGDSLSMSREDNNISFKNTYGFILAKSLSNNFYIVNNSKRANTTKNQCFYQNFYDELVCLKAHYTIIQLGIVDCAPRLISIREKKIINYLFSKRLVNFYIRNKARFRFFYTKYFSSPYVNITEFKFYYEKIIDQLLVQKQTKKIILINISDTNILNKKKSFGFHDQIISYNKIIHKISKKNNRISLINLYDLSKRNGILLDDGIHITKKAHALIAKFILKIVNDL